MIDGQRIVSCFCPPCALPRITSRTWILEKSGIRYVRISSRTVVANTTTTPFISFCKHIQRQEPEDTKPVFNRDNNNGFLPLIFDTAENQTRWQMRFLQSNLRHEATQKRAWAMSVPHREECSYSTRASGDNPRSFANLKILKLGCTQVLVPMHCMSQQTWVWWRWLPPFFAGRLSCVRYAVKRSTFAFSMVVVHSLNCPSIWKHNRRWDTMTQV